MKLTGAKKGIEVGTFTGYSALCLASGLPDDGVLIALDTDETMMNVGKPYWEKAGVANKIQPVIGPALDFLNQAV